MNRYVEPSTVDRHAGAATVKPAGLLTVAILGLLRDQDLHGYELRKRLAELPAARLAASFGSLYPALAKLERKGLVRAVTGASFPAPSVPTSGSLTGELAAFRAEVAARAGRGEREDRGKRGKKVYGLTDQGRDQLHVELTTTDVGDQEFPVLLAFCHQLTTAERLALFERRRDHLATRSGPTRAGNPTSPYLQALVDHETTITAAHLAWIEQLIAAERSGADGPVLVSRGDHP